MTKNITIIQCSSRSEGDTFKLSKYLNEKENVNFVDLNKKLIGQYAYDDRNDDDDFMPLMKEIISNSNTVIFLTPVYWYSMSGIMKAFLDRFTDLLKGEKDLGRQLRGMTMGCISISNDQELDYDFEMPIKKSAGYLGMNYAGHIHCGVIDGVLIESSKKIADDYMRTLEE